MWPFGGVGVEIVDIQEPVRRSRRPLYEAGKL